MATGDTGRTRRRRHAGHTPQGPPATLVVAMLVVVLAAMSGCGERTGSGSPVDLEGRTFLTTAVTQDGLLRHLVDGSELRMTFADGRLAMHAGCNHLRGDYEIDNDVMVVSPLEGTEMGCPDDLMEQDRWLAELLADPVQLSLDDDTLTLDAGDTVLTLVDRRTASPDVPLVGTRWNLTTLIEGETAGSVPQGVRAWVEIGENGRLLVRTGCNDGRGDVEVDEGASTLSVALQQLTRVACEGDVAAVERAMLAVLDGEVEYAVTERALTLTRGSLGLGFTAVDG